MKKIFKLMTLAIMAGTLTFGIASCNKDDDGDDGGNNNSGTNHAVDPTTLISANFENGIPSDWVKIDADGDGYCWAGVEDADYTQMMTGYGRNQSNGITSESYINNVGELTPDNWLVLPEITLPGTGFHVSWWRAAQDAGYPADKYSVYVGTLSGNTFTPIAELATETITAKDQGSWKQLTADLSNYHGQTVRIAFRHYDCTDNFRMILDDVEVSNL